MYRQRYLDMPTAKRRTLAEGLPEQSFRVSHDVPLPRDGIQNKGTGWYLSNLTRVGSELCL